MARAVVMDEASAFPASAASEKRPNLCRKFPIFDCPGLRECRTGQILRGRAQRRHATPALIGRHPRRPWHYHHRRSDWRVTAGGLGRCARLNWSLMLATSIHSEMAVSLRLHLIGESPSPACKKCAFVSKGCGPACLPCWVTVIRVV